MFLAAQEGGAAGEGKRDVTGMVSGDSLGPGTGEPLCSSSIPFTHHKITLTVRRGKGGVSSSEEGTWIPIDKLADLPMPSPRARPGVFSRRRDFKDRGCLGGVLVGLSGRESGHYSFPPLRRYRMPEDISDRLWRMFVPETYH